MSIRIYAVIFLIIPLLLFCGCVDDEAEEEEPVRVPVVVAEDAPNDLEEGMEYSLTDDIVLIMQVGSDPIKWNDYDVYIRLYDADIRYELIIYSINGKTTDASSSLTTEEGDEIIFRLNENTSIVSGDYVAVIITDDEGSSIWRSNKAIKIY